MLMRMLWVWVTAAFIAAMSATMAFCAGDAPDGSAQDRIAELEAQVAELEASVNALGAVVEGTAHPINLGRTSLARVCASSVNGGRSLTDGYYGVLNAFDDGSNWINKTSYTYWLSGDDAQAWIEVAFDHPVSVSAVVVEDAPPFATQFTFAKGGERAEPATADRLELDSTLHGVSKVRLTFQHAGGFVHVYEVRIMGYVPPNVEYTEGPPRIRLTEYEARIIAADAYSTWTRTFFPYFGNPNVDKQDGATVFTFHRNGIDFVRVTVDTSSGDVEVEPLVRVVESRPDPVADVPEDANDGPAEDPPIHKREFPPIR